MNHRPLPAALRWASRWRAAARIARRDATRHRGRTALVAALVALPLIAGSAGLVLVRSSHPTEASMVRDSLGSSVQARVTVACTDGTYFPPPSEVPCVAGSPTAADGPQRAAALVAALPEGSTLLPVRDALVTYVAGDRSRLALSYAELDLTQDVGTLGALAEGRAPRDPSEIIVSGHMSHSAPVDVGDTVALRPSTPGMSDVPTTVELTVVGISRVGAGIRADIVGLPGSPLEAFQDDEEPQTWYVTGDAPVLAQHADLLHHLGLAVLSRDVVDDLLPGQRNWLVEKIIHPGVPGATTATALAIVLLEGVLLIGPAFAVGARRETRHLAIVAAAGGEPADLRRIVLSSGLVVGGGAAVGGTVVGAAIGAALVPAMRTQDLYLPNIALPVPELLALALWGTGVALVAAWLPARQAARTDVVAALGGRRPARPVRRRTPVPGLVCLGVGAVASVVGAITGTSAVLGLGIVTLQLGVIGTSGAVVRLLGRVARRAGPSLRYALRDADRHGGRTAPALAAIIAATALACAGVTYQASLNASDDRLTPLRAAPGTVLVGVNAGSTGDLTSPAARARTSDTARAAKAYLDETLGAEALVVTAAVPESPGAAQIERLRPVGQECSPDDRATDPRCGDALWMTSPFALYPSDAPVIVDEGSTVRALDLPGAGTVARALAAGQAVVSSEQDLWSGADGATFAHLAVPGRDAPVIVPAVAHSWGAWNYGLILPPHVVATIGWTTTPIGLVVPATADVSDVGASTLQSMPTMTGSGTWALVVPEPVARPTGSSMAAVGGAAVLTILATWIVVGLAASESRPDLATISAVGASPRSRRLLAAAQAGVLSVVGTGLGLATGVVFAAVLVLARRQRVGSVGWATELDLPWLLLLMLVCVPPVFSIGGAALAARSRLPVTRRLAS